MKEKITIVYANRDRSPDRIKLSFESLRLQTQKNFKVILVDYGSKSSIQDDLYKLCDIYSFVEYHPLEVSQLLWNKSKALNYGILQSSTPFIFIADVDLIFHPKAIERLNSLGSNESYKLFPLAYLSKKDSLKLTENSLFINLEPERIGFVNGMILASKNAFLEVNGFDEFFHFYGAEDVDLFDRIERAGYKRMFHDEKLFFHNWHQSFSGSEDKLLTTIPRVKNIMRINQRHYLLNKENRLIKPARQAVMGKIIDPDRVKKLDNPDHTYEIPNITAYVEHFLEEDVKSLSGVVYARFTVDPYYHSFKYQIKKLIGRQTQAYMSIKEVNDMVLKKILFLYRDANYSFQVSDDLKKLDFRIQL
jgi:glycosyltransferase involved in cell wall biosynthesis